MRIYVSGSMKDKEEIRKYCTTLRKEHITVLATWLDSVLDCDPLENESLCKHLAAADIAEIEEADLILFFSNGISPGKYIEFGIALQKGLPIVVVGKPQSIFHYTGAVVERFEDFGTFLEWIKINKNIFEKLFNAIGRA